MPHPNTFFVKPASGFRITDPQAGDYLPEGGRLVPRNGYWLRRVKDGDVVVVQQGHASAAQTPNPDPDSGHTTGKTAKGK